ncbi:MAG: hypothetical protein U9N42_03700 [Campylobacterota bacterium]|nr:hypothetical protein [Campylobacterota bacterium]
MKKLIVMLITVGALTTLFAQDKTELILSEIQNLRADMNKRFEQVDKRFEQIDKRLEQVDKRFEQVDKRLDFMQNILYILMGLVFSSPFIALYLRDKRDAEERKSFEYVKGILFVLREMAQEDEKLANRLKAASIL